MLRERGGTIDEETINYDDILVELMQWSKNIVTGIAKAISIYSSMIANNRKSKRKTTKVFNFVR